MTKDQSVFSAREDIKKLITHSGGGDSLAIILEYVEKYGAENIIEKDIQTKDGIIFIPDSRLDIKISTPLMFESKAQTMARILKKYPVDIYKYSYSCYEGSAVPCMSCPACVERAEAFRINNVKDPIINNP